MIKEIQKTQIRDYLLRKNLPLNLLIEVLDHFFAQIEELEKDHLNFEDAFKKVKLSWFAELRFSKYSIQFDLNDTTYFEKKIKEEHQLDLFKKGLIATGVLAILLFIAAHTSSEVIFRYIFAASVITVIISPVLQYCSHLHLFKLDKKYDHYKLTISQNSTRLALISAGAFSAFFYNIFTHSDSLYQTFHDWRLDLGLITLAFLLFLFLLNSYCFFAQRNYLQQMAKVQPFLKHLIPS